MHVLTCPVALTSVVMKVLERLVLAYVSEVCHHATPAWNHCSSPTGKTDALMMLLPCPCICDAALGVSEQICTHPVRRLQFRFQHGHPSETVGQTSSTVTRLINVLLASGLFLLQRPTIILNTGTPQGCFLSPLLYTHCLQMTVFPITPTCNF